LLTLSIWEKTDSTYRSILCIFEIMMDAGAFNQEK
jgi:hypothetical protein